MAPAFYPQTVFKLPLIKMGSPNTPIDTIDSKANGNHIALPKPSKPKKSVKFHSEAAAEDGESRQRIHNALIASYKASEVADAVTPQEDTSPPPRKKQRGKKHNQRNTTKKSEKGERAKQSALSFMLEYYKNRETWKFQKAKQNWILRNAFDVNEIEGTGEYTAALGAYIAGIQSKQARDRLLDKANIILKQEQEDMKVGVEEGAVETELRGERISRAKLVMLRLGQEDVRLGDVQSDTRAGSLKPGAESDETASDSSDGEGSNGSDGYDGVAISHC